jgi:MFS family permease
VYGVGLLATYFAQARHIPDWMIYRMAGIAAFGAAGFSLVLTGILAERMVALLQGGRREHTRLTKLLDRVARPPFTLGLAAILLAAGLYANRYTILEYVTQHRIYVHWSFVMFGLFAVLLAFNLLCFTALDFLLALFPEQMSRLRRARGISATPQHDLR